MTKEGDERARARWLVMVGFMGSVAVGAGAFGAHGLEGIVSAARLKTWLTAAHYLMVHSVALLVLVLSQEVFGSWRPVLWSWTLGSLIFAGSLFALVLTGVTWLGAITPIGGVLLVVGWLLMAWRGIKSLS